MKSEIKTIRAELEKLTAPERVKWALETFVIKDIVIASSLGLEDQALTHMALAVSKDARIVTLDTGRNFQSVYDLMQETMERYGFCYEVYFPDYREVEEMVRARGPNLFYESVENRKLCCRIRKIEPLKRALSTARAWICGLRRDQSITRSGAEPVEFDETFGIVKFNPLYDWTAEQVREYISENNIPYNRQHDAGYESIGCEPCTRPVRGGEDIRSGRWWWETPEKRECGLHLKPAGRNDGQN
ncbi:MAG: phosphoadenosine phosphosulfate reductase [Spirochaetes bacterium GWF1_51_8]|nr:MAG: phosphoadenosine phosphosulfate reductase [Spirochaetes bacterium GWF1_51_8]